MLNVKTCANERNAKLPLAFYSECSQVSSTRSVVKTDSPQYVLDSSTALKMTKRSFVIGEFISGWSHEAWMKIMPCGSLRNERANGIANIE